MLISSEAEHGLADLLYRTRLRMSYEQCVVVGATLTSERSVW